MIKIFVGCSANGEDAEAQAMLEYTLRQHHRDNDIELTWMMLSRDPASPWYSDPAKRGGWNTKDGQRRFPLSAGLFRMSAIFKAKPSTWTWIRSSWPMSASCGSRTFRKTAAC